MIGRIFLTFLLTFVCITTFSNGGDGGNLEYLRLLDDRLMYSIDYKSIDQFPSDIDENEGKLIQITSADQEKYKCIIPKVSTYSKKRIETYTGPTPAQILQPIYDESVCSYKFESYWNYELCHGRYVLQYHEEKDTKKRTEYFLGNYVNVVAAVEAKKFDQLSPPTRKIGDEMRAYYPVTYSHGTVCDLTGKSRQTVVLYVCEENAQNSIFSFTETSSCQYEIIIFSNELCAHPAFQTIQHKENQISCFALGKQPDEDPRPKAVAKVEQEAEKHYMEEYALISDANSARKVLSKFFQVSEDSIEDGFGQLSAILESIKKIARQKRAEGEGAKKSFSSKEQQTQPDQEEQSKREEQPQSPQNEMQEIIEGFWRGTVCLHGGSGWWKYEVCYGKTITQYHYSSQQQRQNVLLGTFDMAIHKAWSKEHPEKAVERRFDGRVIQVTNLYTKGDICEETGAHRSCEMKIRCKDEIESQKVFIYMLEPSTCQYNVVLESAMFCDTLQKVDSFGLLPENSGGALSMAKPTGLMAATEKAEERKEEEEEEEVGEKKTKTSHFVVQNTKLEQQLDGSVKKKMQKTKIEIGLFDQEDILNVVQNLMQGADVDVEQIQMGFGKMQIDENGEEEQLDEEEIVALNEEGEQAQKEVNPNLGTILDEEVSREEEEKEEEEEEDEERPRKKKQSERHIMIMKLKEPPTSKDSEGGEGKEEGGEEELKAKDGQQQSIKTRRNDDEFMVNWNKDGEKEEKEEGENGELEGKKTKTTTTLKEHGEL